jgi:hypothetical protein
MMRSSVLSLPFNKCSLPYQYNLFLACFLPILNLRRLVNILVLLLKFHSFKLPLSNFLSHLYQIKNTTHLAFILIKNPIF